MDVFIKFCICFFMGGVVKRIVSLIFTFLLLYPLAAFGNDAVLRLLIWEGYTPQKFVEEFEKKIETKYGKRIKLAISYALSSDEFFDPVRSKNVDLITVSHHSIKDIQFNYIGKKLILPLDLENIPNHANVFSDLKEADYHLSDGKIYGLPVANGPYGLAYNTKLFEQPPKSWKIFWEPAYKNKYAIGVQEYLYNINITALAMGYPREALNHFDTLNNDKFKKKLRQLAVNSGRGWIGVDKPEDLMGMDFAMSWGDSLPSLKQKGEIWKMADPVEGTMWWVDEYAITWALSDKPFLKKVAEEWINYSLAPDFQINHIIREIGIYPVVKNIADKLTEEEKIRIQTFKGNKILQNNYSRRNWNGLKLLWDQAVEGIAVKR
jgi:spermidine/putrescine-binding protein